MTTSLEMPKHVQELFKKGGQKITDPETRQQLAQLIMKYAEAFAWNKTDLGRCTLIPHRIDSCTAALVRLPSRRTHQQFEADEEEHLRQELELFSLVKS